MGCRLEYARNTGWTGPRSSCRQGIAWAVSWTLLALEKANGFATLAFDGLTVQIVGGPERITVGLDEMLATVGATKGVLENHCK